MLHIGHLSRVMNMAVLLVIITWIIVCIVTAAVIRFILLKIAAHNGYCADSMPMKYHMFGIGAYFTIIYPALYLLTWIF
jgi:hypothetical protein